jgi:hypothetical protein
LEDALLFLKMWLSDIGTTAIAEVLSLDRSIVSWFLRKCFKLIIANFDTTFTKIDGKDVVVEVDESKIGKNKYNRGHTVKEVWIFGMAERTQERRIVLVPVVQRNQVTFEEILKRYVHVESIVHSDCWKAYADLQYIFSEHKTVNHSKNFKDTITGIHTNTIEGNWSAIKRQAPITHRCSKRVTVYLIKYMLKRNYKDFTFKHLIKLLF